MPSLGADMTEGTVLSWFVKPGDRVRRGDLVALIETEKAEIEAEIWQDATIDQLLVDIGQTVPVGAPLARLAASVEGASAGPSPAVVASPASAPPPVVPNGSAAARPSAPVEPRVTPVEYPAVPVRHVPPTYSPLVRRDAERLHIDLDHIRGTGGGGVVTRHDVEAAAHRTTGRNRSSPLARRMAAQSGIDLTVLSGTGPAGAIVAADVAGHRRAPSARSTDAAEPPAGKETAVRRSESVKGRLASNRRAVADLMSRSKREIPHYYLTLDVDCGRALAWLEEANSSRPITSRLLPAALLLRATALSAAEAPELNGHWLGDPGEFWPSEEVALGVAVSLRGGGLLAPVLHRANEGTLDELMSRLNDLVTKARRGTLRAAEMTDPSITVTNLGDQGSDGVYPIIYPPQVAMVGFGQIRERPWAEGGMLGIRPVVTVTLAGDHRATDGHIGSRFLTAIARHLADPSSL